MLTEKQKGKLIKLLQLSTSPIEGEALNAIRFANKILKDNDLTWEEILSKWIRASQFEANNLSHVLWKLMKATTDKPANEFVTSLYRYYHMHGYLTEKQEIALKKVWDNYFFNCGK